MGQYYQIVNVDKQQSFNAHSFGGGIKLMEHSWIGNKTMQYLYDLLLTDWNGDRVVEAGDYFEADENKDVNLAEVKGQLYDLDYPAPDYKLGEDDHEAWIKEQQTRFYVNYDKREFVDLSKLPKCPDDWMVNPLSLLIACGNDRGGGDFHEGNQGYEYVGRWAGDRVGIIDKPALDVENAKKRLTEIKPNFVEK